MLCEMDKEAVRISDILIALPSALPEALVMLMDKQKVTRQELADLSLVAERTIQRIRTGKSNAALSTLIALSIGLNLNPLVSDALFARIGMVFKPTREHTLYRLILLQAETLTIYEANAILVSAGFSPLTKEI